MLLLWPAPLKKFPMFRGNIRLSNCNSGVSADFYGVPSELINIW